MDVRTSCISGHHGYFDVMDIWMSWIYGHHGYSDINTWISWIFEHHGYSDITDIRTSWIFGYLDIVDILGDTTFSEKIDFPENV